MVRGGTRRDDGSRGLSGINIFAALESRRRKSKEEWGEGEAARLQKWAGEQAELERAFSILGAISSHGEVLGRL